MVYNSGMWFAYVCTAACGYTLVCKNVEVRGQYQISFSVVILFFHTGSLDELELIS